MFPWQEMKLLAFLAKIPKLLLCLMNSSCYWISPPIYKGKGLLQKNSWLVAVAMGKPHFKLDSKGSGTNGMKFFHLLNSPSAVYTITHKNNKSW